MARVTSGSALTASEQLIVDAIEDDSYFVENETPSGTVNGANTTFTLAATPNPSDSLRFYVNGQLLEQGAGNDYTLSGATITTNTAPPTGSILIANYRVDPN